MAAEDTRATLEATQRVFIALLPERRGARRTLADWLAVQDIKDAWGEAVRAGAGIG